MEGRISQDRPIGMRGACEYYLGIWDVICVIGEIARTRGRAGHRFADRPPPLGLTCSYTHTTLHTIHVPRPHTHILRVSSLALCASRRCPSARPPSSTVCMRPGAAFKYGSATTTTGTLRRTRCGSGGRRCDGPEAVCAPSRPYPDMPVLCGVSIFLCTYLI